MTQLQRHVHVSTEAAAILLVVPGLLWVAGSIRPSPQRTLLYGIALVTLAVDGWLLSRWLQADP